MNTQENVQANTGFTSQQAMADLWEEHLRDEFVLHDVDKTMQTMVAQPHNTAVSTMTGGVGGQGVREFYAKWFIAQMAPDTETTLVSRTIGENQLVDELIFKFTHTVRMDWLLPGIPPTGKRVEVPIVAVVGFRDGKIAFERIYWDQASVLVQIGLLDAGTLPVTGIESAQKVLDPDLPSNTLIERTLQRPSASRKTSNSTAGDAAIAVVRRNTEEVQGKGNWNLFEELFADDFVDHTPQPGTTPDKAGVRLLYKGLRAAFPDFRPEIHWQVAAGDLVTTYKTYHGTHQGDFLGVAATGKRVSFYTVDAMRVVNGKITEHWGVATLLDLMQQLGVSGVIRNTSGSSPKAGARPSSA
jgi:carboxymethylenebutenolidase